MRPLLLLLLPLVGFGCGYSKPSQTAQPGIIPVVSAIMPNTAIHGGSVFTLTVIGSSFNANAVVNWNGAAQTTQYPATNKLTVQIPASFIATPGMVSVTVTNPGSSTPGGPYGGGSSTPNQTSNSVMFAIT